MDATRSKRRLRERADAARNRRDLIAAGFSRRELFEMGLVTAAGSLVATRGLSARAVNSAGEATGQTASPYARPFIDPLPIIAGPDALPGRVATPCGATAYTLGAAPSENPQPGEGRRRPHQAFTTGLTAPLEFFEVRQREADLRISSDLPIQKIWGYNGLCPGPTYIARYGTPILVRNINDLPLENGGFGLPSVSTHLHNGHTPSESDGFPCDYFDRGQFYDQHYPNVHAGFTNPAMIPAQYCDAYDGGDMRESMSTLWYHDHRLDFTAQNTYKGLSGFYLLFNQFDTGEETTGFRLPSGRFDVPLMFTDRVVDPSTGMLFFDLFNLDGIIGDKFMVNACVQPYFEVHPRRYRFRLLDAGPSRFYQFHLLDKDNLSAVLPFYQISNDGNLLPRPEKVNKLRLSVAERADIIIDFANLAGKTLYLENRLVQVDGRGPESSVKPAGQGDRLLEFRVTQPAVADNSANPATLGIKYYDLPTFQAAEPVAVKRNFRFERGQGSWQINGKFMNCEGPPRFKVRRGSSEKWVIQNNSGGWQHPIHIHFEEFQMLRRNKALPPAVERGRKDVARLEFNEEIEMQFRFRDFRGTYPMHCHNTVHEDHSMMLIFEIDDTGDTKARP
jgi:FtsP/CotA-like multicopper oxidase with cupredoxin domain